MISTQAYQQTAEARYRAAGNVALLSPATLLQRTLTRWANTDAKAAWAYEQQVRDFHARLRHFYYPLLFNDVNYDDAALQARPTSTIRRCRCGGRLESLCGHRRARPHSSRVASR